MRIRKRDKKKGIENEKKRKKERGREREIERGHALIGTVDDVMHYKVTHGSRYCVILSSEDRS